MQPTGLARSLPHLLHGALLEQVPRVTLKVKEGAVWRLADACAVWLTLLLGTAGHLQRMQGWMRVTQYASFVDRKGMGSHGPLSPHKWHL